MEKPHYPIYIFFVGMQCADLLFFINGSDSNLLLCIVYLDLHNSEYIKLLFSMIKSK